MKSRKQLTLAPLAPLPGPLAQIAIAGYEASRAVLAIPIEWVWRGIIAEHQAVEVCGGVGDGKSTFAALFTAARANPTDSPVSLLGREVAPMAAGRRCLWVNEENGRQSAVMQIDRAIAVLGLPLRETWERIVLVSRAGVQAHYLGDPAEIAEELRRPTTAWAAIQSAAEAGLWGLVVLDTRAKILGNFGAAKDEEGQAEAARMVTRFVERAGAPVVVLGHRRKGGGDDLDDVSGSAQRAGGADVVLLLIAEREKGKVVASTVAVAKQRDDDGSEWPSPMRFALRTDDAGKWSLSCGAAAEPSDGEPAHERVHAQLKDGGEMTAHQLRKALGMSHPSMSEALKVLRAEKRIGQREALIGGQKRVVYRVRLEFSEMGLGQPK